MITIGLGGNYFLLHPENVEDTLEISTLLNDKKVIEKDASLLINGKAAELGINMRVILYVYCGSLEELNDKEIA